MDKIGGSTKGTGVSRVRAAVRRSGDMTQVRNNGEERGVFQVGGRQGRNIAWRSGSQ